MAQKTHIQKAAMQVTRWVGSLQSIVIHTALFAASFAGVFVGVVSLDRMLLVLTTIVSLEAIYLAIFIQMTINLQQQSIEEVEQDIDAIQEDIDEIQEDVEEIVEDDKEDEAREEQDHKTLEEIRATLGSLMQDIERLQKGK